MKDFSFAMPTRIYFGTSCLDNLPAEVGKYGKRVMLVYGKASIKKNGIYDKIVEKLSDCELIIDHGGVQPNPLMSFDHEGIRKAIENRIDLVIGIGGGSSMDSAKAIAAGVKNGGDLWKIHLGERKIEDALPVITICTLPATSSESNIWFVFTNDENQYKVGLGSEHVRPKAAFLNPGFTLSVSTRYTALAAADVLSHITEAYFAQKEEFPVNFRMAEALAKVIIDSTGKILHNPEDLDARSAFMWATNVAFNGILSCGYPPPTFYAHKTGHPLSSCCGIPHGATISVMMPAVLHYHRKDFEKRLAEFGRAVFDIRQSDDEKAADECIEHYLAWYREIGAPMSFSEAGIRDYDIEALADQVMAVSGSIYRGGRDEVMDLYRYASR